MGAGPQTGQAAGAQTFINDSGGIAGLPAVLGDENIEVITRSAV